MGVIGLFCVAFLFLPVTRGSLLLRLIDIPFEHATRYHVWLGHLTMLLFTLHGLLYVVGWSMQGNLINQVSYIYMHIFFLLSKSQINMLMQMFDRWLVALCS